MNYQTANKMNRALGQVKQKQQEQSSMQYMTSQTWSSLVGISKTRRQKLEVWFPRVEANILRRVSGELVCMSRKFHVFIRVWGNIYISKIHWSVHMRFVFTIFRFKEKRTETLILKKWVNDRLAIIQLRENDVMKTDFLHLQNWDINIHQTWRTIKKNYILYKHTEFQKEHKH